MESDRRTFTKQTLGSLLTFSLLESVFAGQAFADDIKPIASKWLASIDSMTQDVRGRKLSQIEWQGKVEELFSNVSVDEFLKFVDFEKLIKNMKYREKGERAFRRKFPEVDGLPTNLVFGHQYFALQKGRSVVPHGHDNMATSFLILGGEFHGRHYDRLEDTPTHMIIKPTIDQKFGVGSASTISDHKDNVHWFKCNSDTGFIFNIHVLNIDPEIKKGGRVYVDPFGEKLKGGLVKAKIMESREAHQKFG